MNIQRESVYSNHTTHYTIIIFNNSRRNCIHFKHTSNSNTRCILYNNTYTTDGIYNR